jgi:hypothetical protein
MSRVYTKIGDVFVIRIGRTHKRYFQYVARDTTQLSSDVVRVFKRKYLTGDKPDLQCVVRDDVDFHAHVIVSFGVKAKFWKKEGSTSIPRKVQVRFRSSKDSGNPDVKISSKWEVWTVNQTPRYVGRLANKYQDTELGLVVTPEDIVDRIRTGKYKFVYPGY